MMTDMAHTLRRGPRRGHQVGNAVRESRVARLWSGSTPASAPPTLTWRVSVHLFLRAIRARALVAAAAGACLADHGEM